MMGEDQSRIDARWDRENKRLQERQAKKDADPEAQDRIIDDLEQECAKFQRTREALRDEVSDDVLRNILRDAKFDAESGMPHMRAGLERARFEAEKIKHYHRPDREQSYLAKVDSLRDALKLAQERLREMEACDDWWPVRFHNAVSKQVVDELIAANFPAIDVKMFDVFEQLLVDPESQLDKLIQASEQQREIVDSENRRGPKVDHYARRIAGGVRSIWARLRHEGGFHGEGLLPVKRNGGSRFVETMFDLAHSSNDGETNRASYHCEKAKREKFPDILAISNALEELKSEGAEISPYGPGTFDFGPDDLFRSRLPGGPSAEWYVLTGKSKTAHERWDLDYPPDTPTPFDLPMDDPKRRGVI
jgi:hypothetical protein